jgi:AraC-like DNA-binding protein
MIEHAATDLHHWNLNVEEVCGRFATRYAHSQSLFIGEIERRNLGGTEVAHIRSNAGSISRRKGSTDRADDRFCFLVLQQQGAMEILLESHTLQLQEGELALLDSARAIEMLPRGLFRHVSIHLPRHKLDALRGQACRYGKLSTVGMSGQLLRTMVRQVASGELDHWANAEEGGALENALISLLQPMMQYDLRNVPMDSLRLQAERLIREQLGSAQLSPASIAEQMRMSVRQLYRLFESDNESVCRYIQRKRLEQAALSLLEPALAHRSITDIAFAWGYQDAAHFSRVFRSLHACSPREYRQRKALDETGQRDVTASIGTV